MSINDLYQEVIIDHNRNPRNFFAMDTATQKAEGFNPLCGDRLTLFLEVEDGYIKQASFVGKGCAISTASASLMTEMLKGKAIDEAKKLFETFHNMVTEKECDSLKGIAKLEVLAGVKAYPARVKCATLAWHTLMSALDNQSQPATTE